MVRTISLKLSADLLEQLTSEAKARRITRSDLMRKILESELGEKHQASSPSCYDLARDLAGSVKRLPRDLANPKCLEDLGKSRAG